MLLYSIVQNVHTYSLEHDLQYLSSMNNQTLKNIEYIIRQTRHIQHKYRSKEEDVVEGRLGL